MGKGIYGIANLIVTGAKQVTLFCSWGNYFDRVDNHEDANKLFKMIEKQCPTVIDLFLENPDLDTSPCLTRTILAEYPSE